jgi:hypothetical protein
VNAISLNIVKIIDNTKNLKTCSSNFFFFKKRNNRETDRMEDIIYSLIILKGVSSLPSIKQTGKIFQTKIDNRIIVVIKKRMIKNK